MEGLEDLRIGLGSWYPAIKAVHVLAAAVWSFSTFVAWVYYLKPALRRARRHPDDAVALARRDEFMERFDRGAAVEHVAFGVLVATAGLLLWIGGFDLTRVSFVSFKLGLGIAIILPMEAVDIYLAHGGGNKARIRATGDRERYERAMQRHWIFFRITEPIVVVLIPTVFVLAIVKPF